jgi:hypothetical protein
MQTKSDFDECISDHHKPPAVGQSLYAREHKANKAKEQKRQNPRALHLPETSQLLANGKLASQSFAVIAVLRDLRNEVLRGEEVPEPAVAVLGTFPDKELASDYAKYTAHREYPGAVIDVVDMYVWLFPEDTRTDDVPEVFGIKHLDDIMSGRKDNIREASAYEEQVKPFYDAKKATETVETKKRDEEGKEETRDETRQKDAEQETQETGGESSAA